MDTTAPIFRLQLHQQGLLRPLDAMELSDGTLRYLLLAAALFSPRLQPFLVLNEPENSLHPDLLAPLARLIGGVAERIQVWVVAHAEALISALEATPPTACCCGWSGSWEPRFCPANLCWSGPPGAGRTEDLP